jgi:hypothetical protein
MVKHICLAIALSSTGWAQWAAYPSKAVPMKDGKPDLAAPAPRTAWNTPDLSGLWENARGNRAGLPPFTVGAPIASFANVGAGIKEGLPLRPWAAELLKERRYNNSKNNPDARCLPMGMMQYHLHPQPRKIIQTPELMLLVYEANAGIRQIFLDGRALPGPDAEPWWFGYSVGRWEGDTLVVQTVRHKDMGWLDIWGSPLTVDGKITAGESTHHAERGVDRICLRGE